MVKIDQYNAKKNVDERSEKSIETLVKKFDKIHIDDIMAIQEAYAKKDWREIKRIYDKSTGIKHKIKKASAIGLGRQARQYTAMVSQPTPKEIRYVKQKFSKDISKTYELNLFNLGHKPKTIQKPKTNLLNGVLSLGGLGIVIKESFGWETQIRGSAVAWMDTLHRIKLSRAQIRYLNSQGIYQFRIILKIKFTNSVERYISMAFVKLHDYSAVEAYMDEIQGHIVDKDSYLSQVDPEIYDSVMEILIDWRD